MVKSSELTASQLARLDKVVARHAAYYVKLWKRCEELRLGPNDPLGLVICAAWQGLVDMRHELERLRRNLPQPYRPLASPEKTQGLRVVEHPWAEMQREAARAVEEHRRNAPPETPKS